jgi:DNA (cytosine-5)-methyltransferase 3A
MISVLSLFDGISVAQQALKELGIECKYQASEIDEYAISITKRNFPNTIQLRDIRNVTKEMVGEIDLLIGGSPCQSLSVANKNRQGLSGEKSCLFWEYVRILKEVKPRWFVLENVASMQKEAKQTITETLGVEPIMINASLLSAQSRKRLFWSNMPDIQLPEDRGILLKDILEENVDEKYYLKEEQISKLKYLKGAKKEKREKNGFQYTFSEGALKLMQEEKSLPILASGGNSIGRATNFVRGVASRTFPRYPTGEPRIKQIEERSDEKANAMTTVQTDSMVKMGTLTEAFGRGGSSSEFISMVNKVEANTGMTRKLTLVECERLQSLPDNFSAKGIDGRGKEVAISNTQRYKVLGNAFNCEVIKHILSYMGKQSGT